MTGTSLKSEVQVVPNNDFQFELRKDWPEYNLRTDNVFFKGVPTNMQAITYQGNFIAFRSKDYYVFPHEDIFVTLDPVMDAINGKPMTEHISKEHRISMHYGQNKKIDVEADWKKTNGRSVNHGSKIRTAYVFEGEKFDVTGYGDIVQFGANLTNAIDGQGSLSISPFSYRQVCKNGMMHLSTVTNISENIIKNLLTKKEGLDQVEAINTHVRNIMETSKSFDDLISKIKNERMSHLTKIPLEWITSRVYLIKESVTVFKQKYRQMTELLVSQKQAELIAKKMPKRLVDGLEWMQVKDIDEEIKTQTGMQHVVRKEVTIKSPTKQWTAFNDITHDLTHIERAFTSKANSYKDLDKILVLAQ